MRGDNSYTMEYATETAIGEHKDRTGGVNEDSTTVVPIERVHRDTRQTASVLVLADGAGGHEAGDVASYLATNHVGRELAAVAYDWLEGTSDALDVDVRASGTELLDDGVESAIQQAIKRAHKRILQRADEQGETLYTTIVAGIALGDTFYYGWVGDSRGYVVNEDDESIRVLTRDHSQVGRMEREGEVDVVEATVHPEGNVVTRVLGGSPGSTAKAAGLEVPTGSIDLYADDVVFFTSDGLIDAHALDNQRLFAEYQSADDKAAVIEDIKERVVTDDEIRDVVIGADSLSDATDELVELGNERGGKDNMSFVLARHDDRPETPDDPPERGFAPTLAADFDRAKLARSPTRIEPAGGDEATDDDETSGDDEATGDDADPDEGWSLDGAASEEPEPDDEERSIADEFSDRL